MTSRSTPRIAARSAVESGTVANSTAAIPLGTVCSPTYSSEKLTPKLKKP